MKKKFGCIKTTEKTIGNKSFCFCDGKNDVFYPLGIGVNRDYYEFFIFNRWGELIFESYNPAIGWDGTYKGKVVNIDAYVWLLRTSDNDNQPHEYMGHVTVVK